jgi:hypothetical protein
VQSESFYVVFHRRKDNPTEVGRLESPVRTKIYQNHVTAREASVPQAVMRGKSVGRTERHQNREQPDVLCDNKCRRDDHREQGQLARAGEVPDLRTHIEG